MDEVASVFATPRSSSSTHSSSSTRPAEPQTPPWSKQKQMELLLGGGEGTGDPYQDSSEFEDDCLSPLPSTTTRKTVQQPKTLPSSVKMSTKSSNNHDSNSNNTKSDFLGDDAAPTHHGSFASLLTTPHQLGAPTVSAMAITSLLMNSPGDNSCRSLLNAASLSSLQAAAPPPELMAPFLGGGGRREMLLSPVPRHARSLSPKFNTTAAAATLTTTASSKLMDTATAAVTTTTNEKRDETDIQASVRSISSVSQPSGEPSSSAVTSLEKTRLVTPSVPPPPPPPIATQDDESSTTLLADRLSSNAPPPRPPTELDLTPDSLSKLEKLRAKRRELEEKHEKMPPNRLQASPTNDDATTDKQQQRLQSPINNGKPPLLQRPRQSPPQRSTPRIKKKKKRQGGGGGGSLHSSLSSFNESLSDLLSFNAGVEINIEIEENVNGDDMFLAPLNEDISLSTKHWNDDDDEDEDDDEEYDNKSGEVSLEPFGGGGEALETMGTEYAELLQQYQDLKDEFKDREEELMQTLSNLVAATSSQEFRRLLNSYQALQYHYLELINDMRLAEKNHRKVQDDFRDFQAAAHQREEALMQQLQQKEEKYLKLQEQYESLQLEMEEREERNVQQLLQLEETVLQVSKLVDTQVAQQGSVRSALQVKLKRTLGRTGSKTNSNSKLVREHFFSDSTFDRIAGNVRNSSTGSFNPSNNKRQGSSGSFNCNQHHGHGTTTSSNGSNSSFNYNKQGNAPKDGAAFPARWSFTRSSSEKAVQTKSDIVIHNNKKKKDLLAHSAHIPRG
jgi:hypothetical protein